MRDPTPRSIDVGVAAQQSLEQDAICYLLAEKAREGKIVARLKWGDPFVFDRGGSEALFLHEQGVRFEVVPGVPAGIGTPSYAGVPITYAGGGDTVTLIRGHEDGGKTTPPVLDWNSLARLDGTLALLRRPGAAAGVSERARRARPFARRRGGARLRRHAADPGNDCRDARGPREGRQALARSPACGADRRPRRGVARTPALVRRASAVRQAHARDAAARAGGRAGRPPRSAGRRRRSKRR